MIRREIMAAVVVAVCFSFTAEASMQWAPAPVDRGHGHGGGHGRNAAKHFMLVEGEAASVWLLNPKLSETPLQPVQGKVSVKSTGMDNYHALVAVRNHEKLHESAVRYIYMHGKPSGESPDLLIGHEKAALEIEPSPLAREHWRYHGNTDAVFLLRFAGKPLANSTVELKTKNGTVGQFSTGPDGTFTVPLPDDFSNVKPGRMANRPSEFVLTARFSEGETSHVTTFSSEYHVNPEQWQSTALGVANIVGGILLGALILLAVRRKEK